MKLRSWLLLTFCCLLEFIACSLDEDDDTSIVPNFSPESEVEPETWDDPTARRELFAKIDALVPSDEATYLLHFEELGGLTEGVSCFSSYFLLLARELFAALKQSIRLLAVQLV